MILKGPRSGFVMFQSNVKKYENEKMNSDSSFYLFGGKGNDLR